MNESQATSPLTMRWTPEADASGRTRMVAHWMSAEAVAAAATQAVAHAA